MKKFLVVLGILFSLGFSGGDVAAQGFDPFGDFFIRTENLLDDAWQQEVLDPIFGEGSSGPIPHGAFELPCPQEFNEIARIISLRTFILNVLNFALSFLGLIAVVALIYAGFLYVTAGGDDGQHEKAKKIVIYAAVGIILILASFAIVNTIIRNAAIGGQDRTSGFSGSLAEGITVSDRCKPGFVQGVSAGGGLGIPGLGGGAQILISGAVTPSNATGADDEVINFVTGFLVPIGKEVVFQTSNLGLDASSKAYWNFGDGVIAEATINAGTAESDTRAFYEEGWKSVSILAQTPDGRKVTAQKKVLVGEGGMAGFSISPQSPEVGQQVTFDASGSSAQIGSIMDYDWECNGPGCPPEIVWLPQENWFQKSIAFLFPLANAEGEGKKVIGAFTVEGTHTITLTIKTSIGAEITSETEVEVGPTTPGTIGNPVAIMKVEINGTEVLPGAVQISPGDIAAGALVVTSESLDEDGNPLGNNDVEWSINGYTVGYSALMSFLQTEGNYLAKLIAAATGDPNVRDQASLQVLVRDDITGPPTTTPLLSPIAIPKVFVNGQPAFPSNIEVFRTDSLSFSSESLDENGVLGNVNESWLFNGQFVSGGAAQLSGMFNQLGTYSVKLIAASLQNTNNRDEKMFTIRVKNTPPEISSVSYSQDSSLGGSMRVSANASDLDGTIENYRFEMLEFGSSVSTQMTTQSEAIFGLGQFTGDHVFSFRVTATDSDSGKAMGTSNSFNISDGQVEGGTFVGGSTGGVGGGFLNSAPRVSILATPANIGTTSTNFTFFAEGVDTDGDWLTYEWTFPGGKRDFGPSVSHRFMTPGLHNVVVEVSDGVAKQSSMLEVSIVADPTAPLPSENTPPSAAISCALPGNTGNTDTIFSFYSSVSDDDDDALTYRWDFGNGDEMHLKNAAYKFDLPGLYTVRFQVSDGLAITEDEMKVVVVGPKEQIPPSTLPECLIDAESDLITGQIGIMAPSAERETGEGFEFVTIKGTKDTTFFLYGRAPVETDRALFFEWELGDGRTIVGQNIAIKYADLGIYRVQMNVSDGLTTLSDSLTIKVEEKQK